MKAMNDIVFAISYQPIWRMWLKLDLASWFICQNEQV